MKIASRPESPARYALNNDSESEGRGAEDKGSLRSPPFVLLFFLPNDETKRCPVAANFKDFATIP